MTMTQSSTLIAFYVLKDVESHKDFAFCDGDSELG